MAIGLALLRGGHELDARHLGAVALAVTGLENPSVAALSLGEGRADFLEQLVGRFALVNVADGEATVVQRARPRLGDELLDERAELFGLRLGRLDRAVLDERRREVSQKRELLFAGSAKLPPRFAMPHCSYSSMSSGAAAAARLGGVP